MRAFIYARWAAVWRPDGLCEVYVADVTIIDLLRVHDLARVGLPDREYSKPRCWPGDDCA